MSPPHNDHSFAQASIFQALKRRMREGKVLQEMVIDTEDGHKVADATWMSDRSTR